MSENRQNAEGKPRYSWIDFVVLGLLFIGGAGSIAGAIAIYTEQTQFAGASLWPLPGMVLLLWAALGIFGFVAGLFTVQQVSIHWLQALIFITGMFIPLVILGAFSIGTLVLIAFLFFLVSTVIMALRMKAKFLKSFGLLMLGAILHLGLLYAVITLGNSNY